MTPDLPITEAAKWAAHDTWEQLPEYTDSFDAIQAVLCAAFPYLIAGLEDDEAAVERVARALWAASNERWPRRWGWTELTEEARRKYLDRAVVALRALGGDDA